jgi:hypothetical protein
MTLLSALLMFVSAFAGCLEGVEVDQVDPTPGGDDDTGNVTNGTDPIPNPIDNNTNGGGDGGTGGNGTGNGTDNGTGMGNGTGNGTGNETDGPQLIPFYFVIADSSGAAAATPYSLNFTAPPMADNSPYAMTQLCSSQQGFIDVWHGEVSRPFNAITSWKVYNNHSISLGMFVSNYLNNISTTSMTSPMVVFTQNDSVSGHIEATIVDQVAYTCELDENGSIPELTGALSLTMSVLNYTVGLNTPDMVHVDVSASDLSVSGQYRMEYGLSLYGQPIAMADWVTIDMPTGLPSYSNTVWWDVAGAGGAAGLSPGDYCVLSNLMVLDNGSYQTIDSTDVCFVVATDGLHLEVGFSDVVDEVNGGTVLEQEWNESTMIELRAFGMNETRDYGILVSMRHMNESAESASAWDIEVILIDDPLAGGMIFYVDMNNLTQSGAASIGCHFIDSISLYDRSGEMPVDADAIGMQIAVAFGMSILDCDFSMLGTDLVAGTDWTNYTAYLDDVTMVNVQLSSYWTLLNTQYIITWNLENDTDGDGVTDSQIYDDEITWTGTATGWSSDNISFPVRGPNMAMGLVEGWYCLKADLSEVVNGGTNALIDSDAACFMVELPGDADGDGYPVNVDCDDTDSSINPGATEIWNGVDDDCDLIIDEYIDYAGNATFDYVSETVGWVIKNKTSDYEGHSIYWLTGDNFAYRFIATPDYVFSNGAGDLVQNLTNTPNVAATFQTLGLSESNLSVTMSQMSLGTDTENVEWSYDSTTKIETRNYEGGSYVFKLDGVEFLRLDTSITEYLNYSEFFTANWATANVTMNGSTDKATINITVSQAAEPNLWRLAQSFMIDMNGTMQVDFASQDAIIQTNYNTDEAGAIAANVNSVITNLLTCPAASNSCPNWIAAIFHFDATARAEP